MDLLDGMTAFSPQEVTPNEEKTYNNSENTDETTSQQCSADPSAFRGLHRDVAIGFDVIKTSARPLMSTTLRLTLDLDKRHAVNTAVGEETTNVSVSQLTQASQPQSQFSDLLTNETQHDEDGDNKVSITANRKKREDTDTMSTVETKKTRGYLARLEEEMTSSKVEIVDNGRNHEQSSSGKMTTMEGEYESDNMQRQGVVDDGTGILASATDVTSQGITSSDLHDIEETEHFLDEDDEGYDMTVNKNMHVDDLVDDDYPDTQSLEGDMDHVHEDVEDVVCEITTCEINTSCGNESMRQSPEIEVVQAKEQNITPSSPPTLVQSQTPKRYLTCKQMTREQPVTLPSSFGLIEDEPIGTKSLTLSEEPCKGEDKTETVVNSASDQECKELPTQPSEKEVHISDRVSSTTTPVKNHVALKKREKALPSSSSSKASTHPYEFLDSACQCGETKCACDTVQSSAKPTTASRSLQFSFAIPQSQESESQVFDSMPDLSAMATKVLSAVASIPVSTSSPSREAIARCKRRSPSTSKSNSPASSKRTKTIDNELSTAVNITITPSIRKRGREMMSPDAGINTQSINTPRKKENSKTMITPKDSSTIRSTGMSTPTRTRAPKFLSPTPPSTRTYLSRTKTMFKYKFEFVLTGFVGEGEVQLRELIEEYGGKIVDKYQQVLHAGNTKVIVLATPTAWRKRKFMHAIAHGVRVIHPEWVQACITAGHVVQFEGYGVPSGYSFTTKRFECRPIQLLEIFKGYSFGIPYDTASPEEGIIEMGELTSTLLMACGARLVIQDLDGSKDQVDIVLSDEYTRVCEKYERRYQTPIKSFAWVTECIILQEFLDPITTPGFEPQHSRKKRESVQSALVTIGEQKLKLYTGELILVDLSEQGTIDHFLLFDVCEILGIHVQAKVATFKVGVLERVPNSPGLSKSHVKIVEISPSKIKQRVVVVAKQDFDKMEYRDESIFYYE